MLCIDVTGRVTPMYNFRKGQDRYTEVFQGNLRLSHVLVVEPELTTE